MALIERRACAGMRERRSLLILSTILSSSLWCGLAHGQNIGSAPPVDVSVDGNGIDVLNRQRTQVYGSVSIGPGGPGSLSYEASAGAGNQSDVNTLLIGTGTTNGSPYTVVIGTYREDFTLSGILGTGTFTSKSNLGSTLAYNSTNQQYTFTRGDGTVAVFSKIIPNVAPSYFPKALSLTYPAGERLTFYYRSPLNPNGVEPSLGAVTSNLGYQMRFTYTSYISGSVVLFNMANETCDPAASSCTLTGTWPTIGWSSSTGTTITKNGQTLVSYVGTSNSVTETYPSGRSITYNVDANGLVTSLSDGKGTWTYQDSIQNGGSTLVYFPDQPTQFPAMIGKDHTTGLKINEILGGYGKSYRYDTSGRLTYTSDADGNGGVVATTYTLDARGNRTQASTAPAVAGSFPNIVTSGSFPVTCTNPKTCNKPDYEIDARGKRTDYTYDPAHGGVLTVTYPADANGVRPQVRYGYTAISARYRDGTGSLISGAPVYRLTSISQCVSGTSCVGTANESKTTITYDPDQAALPVSQTVASGNGAVSATTVTSYYPTGDIKTVDGPLAGSDDTTRYYYDINRRVTGVIGPDPDGAGSAKRRAMRTAYNSDDQIISVETGIATDQSDTGMSTFVPAQKVVTTYDAQGRKASESAVIGTTVSAFRQYSYTVAGMLDCSVVRMNPAAFGSAPASACILGTQGSYGPDRITKYSYDVYRRRTVVSSAYGTGDQTDDLNYGYVPNGQIASITDGSGNKISYSYDTFGRQLRTYFPSITKGSGTSSTTDYEELGYDAAGNITTRRLRDGSTISTSYDDLNRVLVKDLPGSELDVSYSYDLTGNMLSAATSAQSLSFTYDALGRNLTQTGPYGTVSAQYDAAGRRTRLTWPNGFYVTYDYQLTGGMTTIKENGTTTLATFAYDDLGRRISFTQGNGVVTTYGYDGLSRLASLSSDFQGSAYDQSTTLAYDPASQIVSSIKTNAGYSWTGASNTNRAYSQNGLNQYTSAGTTAFGYDARGNLTNSGANTYTYSSENLLLTGPGSTSLTYDPLGKMVRLDQGSLSTNFLYDGSRIIATGSGGTLTKFYVPGARADEIVAEYVTTGSHTFKTTDERGSFTGVADASGNGLSVDTYDEFGIPGTIDGRPGYTGQFYLPELGLYYYKARMYSPTLGRFLQTDPLGFVDGTNWYNYVHANPVNSTDPTGLEDITVTGIRTCADRGDCFSASNMANYGDFWRRYGPGASAPPYAGNPGVPYTPGLNGPQTTCFGTANTRAVGPNQAKGDGAFFSKYPALTGGSIRGGTFGTVAVQNGFLGFSTREFRMYGTMIHITFGNEAFSGSLGGPMGSLTVSDYGDKNIQNAPGVAFDIYRFPTDEAANQYGNKITSAMIAFPTITGGQCPKGFSGSPL